MRYISTFILITSAALLLTACGKEGDRPADPAPATLGDAQSPAKAKQAVQAQQSAAAPRGDKSVPLENYQELKSGRQLLYAFLAASPLPVDFDKVAQDISQPYARERDEFKKRDLLAALKPAVEAEVAKAKAQKYYYMTMGRSNVVDKYDFTERAFAIPELRDGDGYHYFNDIHSYQLGFSNAKAFGALKVPDEETARMIEGLRSQYDQLTLRVYFFANDTELGSTRLKGEIMHVQLLDRHGKVLAEQ